MRVIYALVLASLFTLCTGEGTAQGNSEERDRRSNEVIQVARGTIGWREVGRNSGPLVDKILASVGLEGTKAPWCAAWVVYIGDEAFGKLLQQRGLAHAPRAGEQDRAAQLGVIQIQAAGAVREPPERGHAVRTPAPPRIEAVENIEDLRVIEKILHRSAFSFLKSSYI